MTKLHAPDKLKIASLYEEGKSIPIIAEMYDVSAPSVWAALKSLEVPRRSQSDAQLNLSKYSADWRYFSSTENAQVNMWAGFIAADGYVSERFRRLEIEIHPKDSNLLVAFALDIKSNHKIIKNKGSHNSVFIGITSQALIDDLRFWNITSCKSLTYSPPTHLNEPLALDFVKGYFFGDGTLYFSGDTPKIEIIGTLPMVEWIREVLRVSCKLPSCSGSISLLRKDGKQYRVRYGANAHVENILLSFNCLKTYRLERKLTRC